MFLKYEKAKSQNGERGFCLDGLTVVCGATPAIDALKRFLIGECLRFESGKPQFSKPAPYFVKLFPERYLHPLDVVRKAEKYVDAHVRGACRPKLILSHHPDFVSAIYEFFEVAGALDDVRFYLSGNDDVFQELTKEQGIEPIFDSFVQALDWKPNRKWYRENFIGAN